MRSAFVSVAPRFDMHGAIHATFHSTKSPSTDYLLDTVIAYIRRIAANGRSYIDTAMTIKRAMWVIGASRLKDVALWKDRVHLWECAHLGEQNIKMLAFLFRHCLRTAEHVCCRRLHRETALLRAKFTPSESWFLFSFCRYQSLLSADKDEEINMNL